MQENDCSINIHKAIVHILDSSISIPILSDECLQISGEIKEFIKSHILKVINSDDCKNCIFQNYDSDIYKNISNISDDTFILVTQNLSSSLFNIMKTNIDITNADLIFVLFDQNKIRKLAILKLNYHESYVHFVEKIGHITQNKIVKQKTVLPSENQKVTEAAIINLENFSINMIEKRVNINGIKEFYLSKYFMECSYDISPRSKLQIVNKTVEQITKKFYDDSLEFKMDFKKAMSDEVSYNNEINLINVAEKVFQNPEIKEEFKESINKYNILNEPIKLKDKINAKKIHNQTIKTDNGIEINIPIDLYKNKDNLEFINNMDGTISIIIKNVLKISG